jgi:tagatose 1,6-diphosphate aldolase GatY/KbaY
VTEAARRRGAPVALLVSAGALGAPGGDALVAAFRSLAESASTGVCVQVDHLRSLGDARRAISAGANALMVDGSLLPVDDNIGLVREVTALARGHCVDVEAELGRVEGDEDRAMGARPSTLTDPAAAKLFVASTCTACLAVSVGNVHGTYCGTPELDFELLASLAAEVGVPLALHGASGLEPETLVRAVRTGACKVNLNTELRERWFRVVAEAAQAKDGHYDLLAVQRKLAAEVAATVEVKLAQLGWRASAACNQGRQD